MAEHQKPQPVSARVTPKPGVVVVDKHTGKVAELMEAGTTKWHLRPVGGGKEWVVGPRDVRPATRDEELSAKVHAANKRSEENGGPA